MNIDEAYKCPNCGKQEVNIDGMEQIFEDARSEVAVCRHCNAAWRVYYKMADINVKVLYMPESTVTEKNTTDTEVTDVVESEVEELSENHIVNDDGIKPGI